MTVLDKLKEDVRKTVASRGWINGGMIIAVTKPAACVICGTVGERRYGCCYGCASTIDFDDPRVLHESRLSDPLSIEENSAS